MAMSDDEGMRDSQMGVDHHPDEAYQNDTSQNSDGIGSPAILSPGHFPNAYYVSDCSSTNVGMSSGFNMRGASDLLFAVSMYAEPTKTRIIDLAHSAMDELSKIGVAGKPLWVPQKDEKYETLNDIEYLRQYGEVDETLREIMKLVEVTESQNLPSFDSFRSERPSSSATPKAALQTEASRDMAYVKMSPINLVELLMDMNQWSRAFENLVSRTAVLGTLSNGAEGSYDGKLHVMSAEFHLPTPFVPARECYFARYCKQLPYEMWGVVDVSLEKHFPSLASNFRRRPSGCLITAMPNGFSKVIWVEHVEADHSQLNNHFRPLVTTGLAFGANRWLNAVVRHTERSQTMKATTTPLYADNGVVIPQAGRTSFLNLADRMMRSFCADMNASIGNRWMQISSGAGSADVRVMVRTNVEDPGKPRATTVVFSTSLWLKVSPSRLFNFLRHEDSRSKWDLLSRKLTIREFAYMNTGKKPGNRVSLMRAMTSEDKLDIFYLQESCTASTGSYVVYAPLDEFALSALANGANPDKVMILPSGFSILPGGFPDDDDDDDYDEDSGGGAGSLLTIAFHIIESHNIRPFIPPESVVTIKKIITDTVTNIKDAVFYNNLTNNWEGY